MKNNLTCRHRMRLMYLRCPYFDNHYIFFWVESQTKGFLDSVYNGNKVNFDLKKIHHRFSAQKETPSYIYYLSKTMLSLSKNFPEVELNQQGISPFNPSLMSLAGLFLKRFLSYFKSSTEKNSISMSVSLSLPLVGNRSNKPSFNLFTFNNGGLSICR